MKPRAYQLFLPPAGKPDPVPRWRVRYKRGNTLLPVEVCAPDEEMAVMRAGMKRSELLRRERATFPNASRVRPWERVSVVRA